MNDRRMFLLVGALTIRVTEGKTSKTGYGRKYRKACPKWDGENVKACG